jgi:hypothetical protein
MKALLYAQTHRKINKTYRPPWYHPPSPTDHENNRHAITTFFSLYSTRSTIHTSLWHILLLFSVKRDTERAGHL